MILFDEMLTILTFRAIEPKFMFLFNAYTSTYKKENNLRSIIKLKGNLITEVYCTCIRPLKRL
jgi:hypothetical protein